MQRRARGWLVCGIVGTLLSASPLARAQDALAPEGEEASLLEGTAWAPAAGVRLVDTAPAAHLAASGSDDGLVRVWDPQTGREVRRLRVAGQAVSALALSADGNALAAGSADGVVRVWDLTSGRELFRRESSGKGAVVSVALAADGKTGLVQVAGIAPFVWSANGSGVPADLAEFSTDVRAVALSPDAKVAAFALPDRSVHLVDLGTQKELRAIALDFGLPTSVAFSSDGRRLAVGAEGGAGVWEASTGKLLLKHEAPAVTSVRLAFAGGVLALSSEEGQLRLVDVATGRVLRQLQVDGGCCRSIALDQGTLLVPVRTAVRRWDLGGMSVLPPLVAQPASLEAVALSADGSKAVSGGADGLVRLFEVVSGKLAREVGPLPSAITSVAMTSDGALVAAAGGERLARVWEAASGRETHRFETGAGVVLAVAFSPDGNLLATGSTDRAVRLWETRTGKLVSELRGQSSAVRALAFSGDGKSLVSGGQAGGLRVWGVEHGAELRQIAGDTELLAVTFSADGKRIAVGLADGTTRILDAQSGAELRRPKIASDAVTAVAFVGEGKQLLAASRDGFVHVWDLGANDELARLDGHGLGARAIDLGAGGALLAVASGDGAVRLWNLGDRTLRGLVRGGPSGWLVVDGARLQRADDGRFLQKLGEDGALSPVPPAQPSQAPELSADVAATSPPGDAQAPGRVVLRVKNAPGAGRAYWVSVEQSQPADGVILLPSLPLARVDAGGAVELPLAVAALGQGAPAPRDLVLSLKLRHAYGEGPVVQVPLHVRAPRVEISLAAVEGSRAAPVVRVEVANTGDAAAGPLVVTPVFVRGGEVVSAAPVMQLNDLAPGERTSLGLAATPELVGGGAELRVQVAGSAWPTHEWTTALPLTRRAPWFPVVAALAALLLLGAFIYFLRVLRHPVVLQVQRDPNELRRYELGQLRTVHSALVRARRVDGVLAAAKLPETRWLRALAMTGTPAEAAAAFAESIGAKVLSQAEGQPAFVLELPPMHLRFPHQTGLVICRGPQLEAGQATALAQAVHAAGQGPSSAIALDLTGAQNAASALQSVARMSFVVLSAAQLRDLLYAEQPLETLEGAVAQQRPLAELSPYQSSGGVEDESIFFGRERELRTIADRTLHNFIIVAPRQMGKSSLLKALYRRLSARAELEVHHLTLFEDDLQARVARQLGRPRPETPEQFLEVAAGTRRKPRVWLIDEADSFILKDSRQRYPIAQAMRTLSEEGRAFFILAGFWHLYAAAFLNPNNPLRNFGELLRLGPLERDAARELATRPMATLGLSYESADLVERLLDETACRAHLVVAVCKGIIDELRSEDRVITRALLEKGLYENPALADEFKYWRREPLGRASVRAALMGTAPNRGELRERLLRAEIEPSTELFAATLDKLELGYLLVPDAEGRLVCPVPLLRRFIRQDGDLATSLQRDAEDFLAATSPGDERAAGT